MTSHHQLKIEEQKFKNLKERFDIISPFWCYDTLTVQGFSEKIKDLDSMCSLEKTLYKCVDKGFYTSLMDEEQYTKVDKIINYDLISLLLKIAKSNLVGYYDEIAEEFIECKDLEELIVYKHLKICNRIGYHHGEREEIYDVINDHVINL